MKKLLTPTLVLVILALAGTKVMNQTQTTILNTGYNQQSQEITPANLQKKGCTPPPSGMVAWWPLNETGGTAVSDQSPLGQNPGTASNTIGSSSSPKSVTGFVGKGLNFFFGSRVKVNPNLSLNFGTNKSFTIDAWIKGHPSPIVSNLTSTAGYRLFFGDNNKLRLEMGTGSNQLMSWDGPPITLGTWTFVAVVVDQTNKMVTLYTAAPGGTLVASSGLPPIPASADAGTNLPLNIGGCLGNPNGCVTIIDEVEIFNRALTQPELQSIVKAGSVGKCNVPPKKRA